ncbi:hypothetical protein AP6_001 [Salmonella phage TS6]|uniref:Uncharacterized protein n=2 Tax=Cornellvirus TaxID=1910993 RepID=A0A7G3T7D3_9CAUD|nr:hypothetical protein PF620_gp01 [Salmonella phage TS6]YP_010582327.1 hypothetical protein PF621_gp29 [Salmonella phage vB_SenTO17]AZF89044.1 hypothetical protein AP6_001 [Salmonella phage TS6]QJQ80412.1 hypothetical protein vBSenTO17_29 [Salmonella phage vB_SenTO17]
MFKKGSVFRCKSTGNVYLVDGPYSLKARDGAHSFKVIWRNDFELIGNNYQAKSKCSH